MNQQETVDEILTRFKDVWDPIKATIDPLATDAYEVAWPDVPLTDSLQAKIDGADNATLEPWARITIRTNLRKQKTVGGVGNRIFESLGILFVEIFTPTGDGNVTSYQIAETVRDEYEEPNVASNHVWFRNATLREGGIEGLWSRTTVTVEWQAEQVK